ncbi:hypothetical protein ACH49G_06280 [Streptomyces chrestomyceticus]|uniref:hypothetical protein n=1 Tax=Streptomyces chrestomyceticus TaxID=68185 RepID=UPI0037952501
MTDTTAERIEAFIEQLRIPAGTEVDLERDFDPGSRAGIATNGDVWARRYREINAWERYPAENGVRVVKLMLNLSKEEQRIRFLKRIDMPEHNWKFSAADVRERAHWDAYQRAFSQMLSATSTAWAPWYVVPADRKWLARLCAAAVLAHTLIDIGPQYPRMGKAARQELAKAKKDLEKEAPKGARADPYAASAAGKRHERHGKNSRKNSSKGGRKSQGQGHGHGHRQGQGQV